MEQTHKIGGKERRGATFRVKSPFPDYPDFALDIPRLDTEQRGALLQTLQTLEIPPLNERREMLRSLGSYTPSEGIGEAVCKMTGMPISLLERRIEEGKKLVRTIAERETKDGPRKTIYAAISPNDPMEPFFFFAHLLLAGTPAIVKVSRREPSLAPDILEYLQERTESTDLIHIVHGDTSSPEEASYLRDLISCVDLPIVMGDARIAQNQLSFSAEHSRAIVLDAGAASPYLNDSVQAPSSCLAVHNYLVVGKANAKRLTERIIGLYEELQAGDLMDRRTTRGIIESDTLQRGAELISMGRTYDTARIRFPQRTERLVLDADAIHKGVVLEHHSEDPRGEANPFMTTPLPLYLTAIRCVDTPEQALADLHFAKASLQRKFPNDPSGGKCMALAVYGDNPLSLDQLKKIGYDIFINRSPLHVDGRRHQGIDLNEVLTQ